MIDESVLEEIDDFMKKEKYIHTRSEFITKILKDYLTAHRYYKI